MNRTLYTLLFALTLFCVRPSQADVTATFNSASDVPVTAPSFSASGETFSATLNFAPPAGTNLMVVKNTGLDFINGTFSNLAQGQEVALSYAGIKYQFIANYYGGTGNDLVLQWVNTRPVAWGQNFSAQIGDNSTTNRLVPVDVLSSGVLSGKTVLAMSAGNSHSLALCSDGTVAAWGSNLNGQLGNNSTTNSLVPVAVTTSGVLSGKTVIAVAAGNSYSLALCSDGTVAAWGNNDLGQLGNNSTTGSLVPVAVTTSGVLSGKTVVAVAAGQYHSLALCSDGTVAAWGNNTYSQLGNNNTTNSKVPVPVSTAGVLSSKTIIAVAAGYHHSLALCSDGSIAAWGYNEWGQLGDNSRTASVVPVAVNTAGVLSGKTVVAIAAGYSHSLALCSDGSVATWGNNEWSQLGNTSALTGNVPVPVNTSGVLSGKTVVAIAAGYYHNLALCSDGTVAAWGYNAYGRLGNNSTVSSDAPVAVSSNPLAIEERYVTVFCGSLAEHNLGLIASPPSLSVSKLTATHITSTEATLNGAVKPNGSATSAQFEYGTTTSYGSNVSLTLSPSDSFSAQNVSASLSGLTPRTIYHYRLTATNAVSTVSTADGTFTTSIDVAAAYNSAADVPVTAASFSAAEATFSVTLNFAPPVGTNLMVVKNTGLDFINGTFSNLAQGQLVVLSYGGTNYRFIANYYGGTGNDLVLQWAQTRPVAWGHNTSGQIGDNSTTNRLVPVDVLSSGLLSGKTIVAVASGLYHSLALCSDGTVTAWGNNSWGQLGNNSTTGSKVPVPVSTAGVLSGKTVIAVAAGGYHSLALCSDGTVAAWGRNSSGQLGDGSITDNSVPVLVNNLEALSGKTIVAIAAGEYHSLLLCSDSTVVAWGYNEYGQLGNNSTIDSPVPVQATTSGVLSGKTVVAVAAGDSHNLALCSDGTVAAWGYNVRGELGNNSTADSSVPVPVNTSGVLSSKTVVAVAAGSSHSLALCSDGTVAAWGYNASGHLGDNSTTPSSVPVAVDTSGVLSGKMVTAAAAGQDYSLALCSDGTVAAWGNNTYGQLGNNSTTNSSIPVPVSSSPLASGERYVATPISSAATHNLGIIAMPPFPIITNLPATNLTTAGATLNGTITPSDNVTTAQFEYGTTTSYGSSSSVPVFPSDGKSAQNVSTNVIGLTPGTTYHYRLTATSATRTVSTMDRTFTTVPGLTDLVLSAGTLSPPFTSDIINYTVTTSSDVTTVTPTVAGTSSTVKVNGVSTLTGSTSGSIALGYGANPVRTVVTAQDGSTTRTYTVTVIRTPQNPLVASYATASDAPLTTNGFTATGGVVSLSLNFAPPVGTNLMVVKNTGLDFINGTFSNLAQGQEVPLSYGGIKYRFIANYYGGNGNDLVLQWAQTRPVAWGNNTSGQIGDNSTTNPLVPVDVLLSGVLSGKTVLAMSAGNSHSLALCSDGTVAAWGYNSRGQLGDNSTTNSLVPVAVNTSGVLSGKTVVAVAAGDSHSLALCSDGTVAAWGDNVRGELGNNSTADSSVPVAVNTSGVLSGKTVVSVAAGTSYSLALCSDGTVAAWGYNASGQLGDNSTTSSSVPVAVNTSGVLSGKMIVAMTGGGAHSLALCSDGTLVAWGFNFYGQLGNGITGFSKVPVAVNTTGVLAGKAVIAVAAGNSHSLALCSDGTVAAWGYNLNGQLGNNSTTNRSLPVAVNTSGVLSGKTVFSIVAGQSHSLALCSDGTLATWGFNTYGQLGNNSRSSSTVPVAASSSSLTAGERYAAIFNGSYNHNLGFIASPAAPGATSLAATNLTSDSVILNGTVNAVGGSATVTFDYGLDTSYGSTVTALPSPVTGSTDTAVGVIVTGLKPDTTYHYRVRATSSGGTTTGADLTFTTLPDTTGPVDGTMTLTPASPVDAGSALTVTFANWTDPSMPLSYSVLLDDVLVSAQGASSTPNITAPTTAGTHTLKGRIYDALNHFTEVTQSFTVVTTQQEWRTFYFGTALNEGNAADMADPDSDGANNLFEYVAGLVPTSAQSRFNLRVEAVAGQPGQKAITFSPVLAGRTYTVKYKESLTDENWTPLTDIETSDNGTERTVTDLSSGNSLRFYRVEISRP